MAYPERLVDKRVVQRNVQKGLVDAKEHEKGLKQLPDRADNIAEPSTDDTDEKDA
jgi:hypothetical protein